MLGRQAEKRLQAMSLDQRHVEKWRRPPQPEGVGVLRMQHACKRKARTMEVPELQVSCVLSELSTS